MTKYKKGMEMRARILDLTRRFMNEEGLLLTLDQLAKKMGITKGRITNYFPTKDQLFVELSKEYDLRFQKIVHEFDWSADFSLIQVAKLFAHVMDNQYRYRSVIYYSVVAPCSDFGFSTQLQKSYAENGKEVLGLVNQLISSGILKPEIVEKSNYEVFLFQSLSVFTNWVMTIRTFHRELDYEAEKHLYLKSILMCYYPYLTDLGKSQFEEIKKR